MATAKPYRIRSIAEVHRLMAIEQPHHPLISIIDLSGMKSHADIPSVIFDFYTISMKRGCDKLFYGQQKYDFDEGLMAFMAPGQILRGEDDGVPPHLQGWMLFIHPDFLWNTPLAKKIRQYDYFSYATSEALFLSGKEETLINGIIDNIRNEYRSNIDKFSQEVIIAHIELLLTYAHRFYERQFITRKITNSHIVARLEEVLDAYFASEALLAQGLPTVQYIAGALHLSPKYLGSLLRQLTGQTTQQHIHERLIAIAKEKLSATQLSISEIAYQLGFEHSQSFSKIFKQKTRQSPLQFRQSFG